MYQGEGIWQVWIMCIYVCFLFMRIWSQLPDILLQLFKLLCQVKEKSTAWFYWNLSILSNGGYSLNDTYTTMLTFVSQEVLGRGIGDYARVLHHRP
jgi:hypothetical protein